MSGKKLIDEATLKNFREDGAVVLRGFFTGWIERLQAGVERNIAEPSADVRIDGATRPALRRLLQLGSHSGIPRLRLQLAGSGDHQRPDELEKLRLFHEHVLVKEPGADVPTPWHHDQPYYCVDGAQNVSLWAPLDPVGREVVPE